MGPDCPPVACPEAAREAAGRRPPDPQRHPVDVAHGGSVAGPAPSIRERHPLPSPPEGVASPGGGGTPLEGRGKLDWSQAFLDGTFIPAKKGARQWDCPAAARGPS